MATIMITSVKPFKLWFKWDRNVGSQQYTKRYSIIVHVKIGALTIASYIMESRRCEPRIALCVAPQWLHQL